MNLAQGRPEAVVAFRNGLYNLTALVGGYYLSLRQVMPGGGSPSRNSAGRRRRWRYGSSCPRSRAARRPPESPPPMMETAPLSATALATAAGAARGLHLKHAHGPFQTTVLPLMASLNVLMVCGPIRVSVLHLVGGDDFGVCRRVEFIGHLSDGTKGSRPRPLPFQSGFWRGPPYPPRSEASYPSSVAFINV